MAVEHFSTTWLANYIIKQKIRCHLFIHASACVPAHLPSSATSSISKSKRIIIKKENQKKSPLIIFIY